MADIIISPRQIILFIVFMGVYFYLSDMLMSKEFKQNAKMFIQKGNNNTGHTILDSLESASNTAAGTASFTSVAIINKLPVS